MLGDLLDNRYRIIRTLSKGGFGQTYIAEDTRRPGCPRCVMKHLKPIVLDPNHLENARRLFQTEAIALEKLGHHPQIPRLLAYFEENNDFYLVQDLIRGYPLTKELKPGFRWLEADIYQLLYNVLSILIFVHDRGVIHRDIKPDNIIRRQLDRALVLVDFGSVKQIRTHIHPTHEIGQTISIGTVGYMSTEQAHGRPRPNSDLYSLGIIGIQAATGMKPKNFQEDGTTGEFVWRHHAHLSDELATFLEKMVAYHFKDRYLDARAALRALKKINLASSPRHSFALEEQSYNSLQPARLDIAMNAAEPAFPNASVSPPTFIELPEPTETDSSGESERLEERLDDTSERHHTMPMAYVAPLVHPGADATTAEFADRQSPSMVTPLSTEHHGGHKEMAVQTLVNSSSSVIHDADLAPSLDEAVEIEPSHVLPPVMLSADETLSSLSSLKMRLLKLWPTRWFNDSTQYADESLGSQPQGFPFKMTPQMKALFVVLGGLGVLTLSAWGAQTGFRQLKSFRQQKAALTNMKLYKSEGRYLDCQQLMASLEKPSDALTQLAHQCAFQGVQQLVSKGEWEKAIAIAKAMPGELNPHHNEAQVFIRGEHILSLTDAQQEGDLTRAMTIADEIAPDHPLQAEIQLARLKWQAQEKVWVESFDLLEQGKWEEAINRVRPLENSPYFQERAKALIKDAELNQKSPPEAKAEITTPEPSSAPSSTAEPTSSTPSSSNPVSASPVDIQTVPTIILPPSNNGAKNGHSKS